MTLQILPFQNLKEKNLTFEDVFERILHFMYIQPRGNYKLIVGTDSQVHPAHTLFITGIVVQNAGKGAWACIRKCSVPRKMLHLHERISFETSLTEEIVALFDEEKKNKMIDVVLPFIYQGASFTMEGHLDIGAGSRNKTKEYVAEMVARMESIGVEAKIKPEAYVASSYANKFTK